MNNQLDMETLTLPIELLNMVSNYFKREKEGDITARSCAAQYLKNFLIETSDGSYTLKSSVINGSTETMHTHHGAVEESIQKYIEPAKLNDKIISKDEIRILDTCSGLGYNAAATLDLWQSIPNNCKIKLDMVEISRETLAITLLIPSPLKSYEIIKKAVEDELFNEGFLSLKSEKKETPKNVDINIYCMDIRELIKNLLECKSSKAENVKSLNNDGIYDIIFLDPFSPLLTPELYTLDFFRALKQVIKKDGLILTYTSAAPVRSAFIEAGFNVGEGPRFGRKRGGTIASISAELISKDLLMEDERMIALSDVGVPFRDPNLNSISQCVEEMRSSERESLRNNKMKFASTVKTPIYLLKDLEDGRLKRRVLKNLHKMGFEDLNSPEFRYILCPQYMECVCGNECESFDNSRERINEMSNRLQIVIKKKEFN
ncbi:MAG: tRNA (5-methylaminomethyl-2-thiouridine)(34)-methyltransferase MnmD [Methanobacterium sp.]|jgi:tRNA U34 5-methylaminomethyl-2-thiouridine-forming methyltransferase MnmC